ncbi:acyl dehydratase [Pseudochelatococcus lubricantis]|uniref:Acyl dehydratase n=1 Tax=Pseudochelatococcus lubricantis TaxID=1538102 RepID=A0ABX0V2Z7_9HYPH|nr:MaoC/PaaZ C-terminal domain-containing protein [Pseudochelatococcus lubricantis]NIJ58919.1 acyl dehydratase [Pseudochelatococcus lubricantis]
MALNVDALEAWAFPRLEQDYTDKDTMLYAVSLGFGQDPLDPAQLPFVFENGLTAVPTMPAILCHPGRWTADPALGVTLSKVVHGEQRVFLHRPLAPVGRLYARARVAAVEDKGEKGAVIHAARTMFDAQTGAPVASVLHSSFCRADGGFGRSFGPVPRATPCPERISDYEVDVATRPEQALIYRLNSDRNPLHADPAYAAKAGFDRPILHGLCTYGLAVRALLPTVADGDAAAIRSVECRFSRPVFPGETVRFEIWSERDRAHFRARVEARNVTVLDAGCALLGDGHPAPDYALLEESA